MLGDIPNSMRSNPQSCLYDGSESVNGFSVDVQERYNQHVHQIGGLGGNGLRPEQVIAFYADSMRNVYAQSKEQRKESAIRSIKNQPFYA